MTKTLINSWPTNMGDNANNGQCSVHIVEVSLFDVTADAFLVSIGENCRLKGEVATYIKENFSNSIEKRLKRAAPLLKGECIFIEDQGKNFIFGMPFDYEITQLTIAGVEMVITRALQICESNRLKSIAVPAIATNFLPSSDHSINNIIQLGIVDHFTRNPVSTLEKIYLVNYRRPIFAPMEIEPSKEIDDKTIYLDVEI